WFGIGRREQRHLIGQFPAPRVAAQAVDGTVSRGRRDPATRVGRHAVGRPPAQGDGERLLYRILGDVDVTEDADQAGNGSAGLQAEDAADLGLVRRGYRVDSAQCAQTSDCRNGRTSIGFMTAAVVLDAQAIAASRSSASMM